MKKIISILAIVLFLATGLEAQRIKDIAYFKGTASEQVIGYGLVVGLAGTGDSYRSEFTVQSVSSMLKRFGITVPQTDLRIRNVAAVMVTAKLNGYQKPGAEFDVNVASMGDATSLQGGLLLMTPLSGMSGNVYGFAQGSLSIGGYDINTSSGSRLSKNHALAGRIPAGGVLQAPIERDSLNTQKVTIVLKSPDFTTSNNISQEINKKFPSPIARSVDASEISVDVPADKQNNMMAFLAELESIQVQSDAIARVVLNERTGTIVSGSNVKIMPATISHGNLNITIRSFPVISQPNAFSNGSTVVVNNQMPFVQQDEETKTIALQGASSVQEVAAALNSLKVAPRDIISIFQALKESGALIAELVIM